MGSALEKTSRCLKACSRKWSDANRAPEILSLRDQIRSWRFYDHFRVDPEAPARQPQLGTRTPVLSHDGRDVAAALQTIREIGDGDALDAAVADAFPGARITISGVDGRFDIEMHQHGLLRPLRVGRAFGRYATQPSVDRGIADPTSADTHGVR